ncbi:hypothetical protein AMR72_17530 [Flavobacterium psychrophilum]|nr:hypothetical protein AMR72_17530 [Flavobacterium psychrophilum]AOE54147.1 hypothetical protein ALW18_17520 [Flavobacterium psychrophilum]
MTSNIQKKQTIESLLAKRKEELANVYGGKIGCVPGCSGEPIGCGPDACIGPCPKACLSQCMSMPSCKGLDSGIKKP